MGSRAFAAAETGCAADDGSQMAARGQGEAMKVDCDAEASGIAEHQIVDLFNTARVERGVCPSSILRSVLIGNPKCLRVALACPVQCRRRCGDAVRLLLYGERTLDVAKIGGSGS